MRHEGKITRWVDKRGFGFIASDDEDSVFLHIKSFETKVRRPYAGDRVTYELAWDKDGRPRAENARFVGEAAAKHKTENRSHNSGSGESKLAIQLTLLFLCVVIVSTAIGRLHYAVAFLFVAASLVTYVVYAIDKASAQSDRWRIPEFNLHVLALVCGWPGALLAQRQLRHKSSKTSFLTGFWFTALLNVAAVLYLIWMGEAGHIYQLIDAAIPFKF